MGLQDNGKGIMMQAVHTEEQVIYANPGDVVRLHRPDRCAFTSYLRWYCYDTDRAADRIEAAPALKNDKTPTNETDQYNLQNNYGWFAKQLARNNSNAPSTGRTSAADSLYYELLYTMHEGDSVYRIAADQSNYKNSNPGFNNWTEDMTLNDPLLSKRLIYEMRPAKWMADSMELCKSTSTIPTSEERFLEVHEMMAPTNRRLYIGPDYRFYNKNIDVGTYIFQSRPNYYYLDGTTAVIMDNNDNWKWRVDNGAEKKASELFNSNNATTKITSGQFIEAFSNTPDTVTYTLRYKVGATYYNVAKFHVIYINVGAVGPSDTLPPPTHKMELLYEKTFNDPDQVPGEKSGYTPPAKGNFVFWNGNLKVDESTYGYYYSQYRSSRGHHGTINSDAEPNWSEYGIVNGQDVYIDTKNGETVQPWVYNHVDSTANIEANAEKGYMLFVDGSQNPGLVFNLEVEADLCAGSTMYFSAWVCDASSKANTTSDKNRSAPNLDFIVSGEQGDTVEHVLETFTTGEFGINAPANTAESYTWYSAGNITEPTNHMKRAKWYQVMFPVKFDKNVEYDKYRLKIMNKGKSSDGNDFCIDDIRIYVQRPPVMPIQASTSDCIDKAVDSIRAYLRIDYQEIDHNGDPLYYQWREGDKIVHNAYFNVDGPSNDYGKVNILADGDITPADTCSDLFSFDKKFRETKTPIVRYIKEQVDNVNTRYVMYIAMPMEVRINHDYTGFVAQHPSELGKRDGCGTFADMLIAGGTRITINDEITFGDSVVSVCGNRDYTLNIVLTKIVQDETQGELRVDTTHCRADWLIGDSAYVKAHPEIYKYSFEQIETYLKFYRNTLVPPAATQMVEFLKHHSLLTLDTASITMSPGVSLTYTAFPLDGTATDGRDVCVSPRFLHINPSEQASNMMVVGKNSSEYDALPEVVKARPRIVRISDSQRKEGWFDVPLYLKGTDPIDAYKIDTVYLISSTNPECTELGIIADHRPMSDPDTIHFGYNAEAAEPIKHLKPGYDYTFHVAFEDEDAEKNCARGYTYFTLRVVPDTVIWLGGDWNLDASWDYAIPMDTTNVVLMPDSNYNVTFATDPAESFDVNYTNNKCRNVYIPAGASMAGQQNLEIRGAAFIDIPVPAQKWALTSMPIKGIVSGDLFVSQNESTDPFVVAHIEHGTTSETAYDRYTYEVYDSPYDADNNTWLRADSNLSRPIRPYDAVMVAADYASGLSDPVIRLPKPDNYYRYYDFNTNKWLANDTTVTPSSLRDDLGKPAWDGSSTVTLTRAHDTIYVFGNPTFGYIDLTQLVADNPGKLTGRYYMTPAEGSADPTIDLAKIDPSAAHVLLPPCRGALLVGNGDDEITITINVTTPPATPSSPAPKRRVQSSSTFDAKGGMPIGAIGSPVAPGVVVDIDEWSMTIDTELSPWLSDYIPTLRMNRELYRDGAYNTICLPFSMTADDIAASPLTGAQIYTFTHAEKASNYQLDIEVAETDHIDAGVPYLIKWAPTDPEIIPMPLVFNNVYIETVGGQIVGESDEIQFVGSVPRKLMVYEDKNNLFVGANNTLYWPNTHNPLRGFRAYFQVPTVGPNAVPKNTPSRIVERSNTPTDVESTQSSEIGIQKLIIDGNVYILRDGKLYSILGQNIQ